MKLRPLEKDVDSESVSAMINVIVNSDNLEENDFDSLDEEEETK